MASFAIWFGGFGFYASIVVPIGTGVLGSARRQGLITQQVTDWLNLVCLIAVVLMATDLAFGWRGANRRSLGLLACVLSIGGMLLWLAILHGMLDSMIDEAQGRIADRARFYLLHRYYLWISSVQWFVGWIWLALALDTWRRSDPPDS